MPFIPMPRIIFLAASLWTLSLPTQAQTVSEVHFQKGHSSTDVSGSVTGHQYADYVLGANGGQTMRVSMEIGSTNGNGTAYFNILPPGSDGMAIFTGSMETERRAEVRLPESGDYTVRVYLMGNDRDTDKSVEFTLKVAVTGKAQDQQAAGGNEASMLDSCRSYASGHLRIPAGIINVTYEGRRTDGTHAVNGDSETEPPLTFQCSFAPDGQRIAQFTLNAPAGCPVDVSEADRYRYPDCT